MKTILNLPSAILAPLACSIFILSSQNGEARILDELNSHQVEAVLAGTQVVTEETRDHSSPWPAFTIYQRVKASAQEGAAVFYNYDHHTSFVPNLIKSHVVETNKNVSYIDYELRLPMMFGVEAYRSKDTLSSYDSGTSFQVQWVVGPVGRIKESVGSVRYEPLENSTDCIMAYESFVYPNFRGASFIADSAKSQLAEGVAALAKQIADIKSKNPALMNTDIAAMQKALEP